MSLNRPEPFGGENVVNSFLSISVRKLYVRALRRRSTTVSLRKGPYGRVQLSRPSSQQQRSHFRLIYFYSFFLFLSYLLYTFLLYTFLFSHFCCTHFFSLVFCVRIFAIFGLLSRADILNRTEEKTLVLLVENEPRVFVIALDLVFTKWHWDYMANTHRAWWALSWGRPEFPGWNVVVYSNISWKKKKVVWTNWVLLHSVSRPGWSIFRYRAHTQKKQDHGILSGGGGGVGSVPRYSD